MTANKLDVGGGIAGGGANIDGFGSGSNKTLIKSKKSPGNSGDTEEPKFLTSDAREAFNHLKQAFTKAPILRYFDLELHIRIETDTSAYSIGGVLSQLISDQVTSSDSISS